MSDSRVRTYLYRPKLNTALLDTAKRPIVQSLLYDLDILPEQLSSQKKLTVGLFEAYNRLEGILLAFKYLEMQGVKIPWDGTKPTS